MHENSLSDHPTGPIGRQIVVRGAHQSPVEQTASPDHRIELYARLRTILENATESIRALKDENAALERKIADVSERNGALDRRLRAATVDLESDERALRESADLLDQLLRVSAGVPHEAGCTGQPATPSDVPTAAVPAADTEATVSATDRLGVASEPTPRLSLFKRVDR